jgi:hypothetical protein
MINRECEIWGAVVNQNDWVEIIPPKIPKML